MQVWLYLVLSSLVCAYAWFWMQWSRARHLLAGLPTFTTLPFVGNIHKLMTTNPGKFLFNVLVEMSARCEEANMPFVFWLATYPIVVVSAPDDVRAVTNAFVDKPFFYHFARLWLGDGLVVASGAIWKQNIKKIGGTFTASTVDGYQDVFNSQGQRLVHTLRCRLGAEPFDALHDLSHNTLETICKTALGFDDISQEVVTEEYYRAFNKALVLLIERGLNPLLYSDRVYECTPAFKEMKRCTAVIHSVSDSVMKRRKLQREKMKIEERNGNGTLNTSDDQPKFKAIIDILMDLNETGGCMTDEQIKNEVDVTIVGGQETVATTLFYTLLMLGCRKEVQDKLSTELKDVFGESTRAVNKQDLSRLRYCEAVIKETLRLFPPIPAVMRYADHDLELKSCRIPKGSGVVINVWGAGRSVSVWGADAEEYRPERWLQQEPPGEQAAFLAFSYGRRACIGKRYAIALLKTLLAFCVRELEFISEADKLDLRVDIALRPVSGHLLEVRSRRNQHKFPLSGNNRTRNEELQLYNTLPIDVKECANIAMDKIQTYSNTLP